MADEMTVSGSMAFSKNGRVVTFSKTGLQFDVSGQEFIHHNQTIGTSEEAIVLGDVGTPGWFMAYNHDATNYVEIRPASGVADLLKIGPGEFAGPIRLAADAVPYAIANAAPISLEYVLVEA